MAGLFPLFLCNLFNSDEILQKILVIRPLDEIFIYLKNCKNKFGD